MANLPESTSYDAGVYQIEIVDAVIGGVNGISNLQAKALANRTNWLKNQVDALNLLKGTGIAAFSAASSYAGGQQVIYLKNIWRANTSITPGAFNSANWTRQLGTAAELDATTDVPAALGTAAAGTAVTLARADHVHANPTLGFLSDVTITANTNGEILRWNGSAWINNTLAEAGIGPVASPIFTGDPQAPKPAAGDNDVSISTTSFVQEAVGGSISIAVAGTGSTTLTATQVGYGTIYLTGVLTGARILVMPAGVKGHWTFVNNTTGAFSLTIKYAAGTSVVVTQGTTSSLIGDAVNIGLQQTDFIDPVLRGSPTAPTPAQFDDSQLVPSTAFIRRAMGNYSGYLISNTAQTLTANHCGQTIELYGSVSRITTLPLLSAVGALSKITFINLSTVNMTISTQGADTFLTLINATTTSLVLLPGDTLELQSFNGWVITGGSYNLRYSGQFATNSAANGYLKSPSGVIQQWQTIAYLANVAAGAAPTLSFNWPIGFTSGPWCATATLCNGSYGIGGLVTINTISISGGVATFANPPGNVTWGFVYAFVMAVGL